MNLGRAAFYCRYYREPNVLIGYISDYENEISHADSKTFPFFQDRYKRIQSKQHYDFDSHTFKEGPSQYSNDVEREAWKIRMMHDQRKYHLQNIFEVYIRVEGVNYLQNKLDMDSLESKRLDKLFKKVKTGLV